MTNACPNARDSQSGLTLIEMLICLAIMGIATSAALLSVNMLGRDRRVEDEAVRLAAHLTMAVDKGLVSRERLALFWTSRSYEVKRETSAGWQTDDAHQSGRIHALPAALVLRRTDGTTEPVVVSEDGLGPAVTLEISGQGVPWIVAFDGFSATARPGG